MEEKDLHNDICLGQYFSAFLEIENLICAHIHIGNAAQGSNVSDIQ